MVESLPNRSHDLTQALDVLAHVSDSSGTAERSFLSLDELFDALVQDSLLQQVQLSQLSCR